MEHMIDWQKDCHRNLWMLSAYERETRGRKLMNREEAEEADHDSCMGCKNDLGDRAKMIFADDALKCSLSGCIMLANGFCSYGEKTYGGAEG